MPHYCTFNILKNIFTASEDYNISSFPVIFVPDSLSSRSLCSNISIIFDGILEVVEDFFVTINSFDPSVLITQSSASVFIEDNSGKFLAACLIKS